MSLDVDKYRNRNETEREWLLKRTFIEQHQGKFDEQRLLCLAQCYVNMETLGCRYSAEITKQVRELTAHFEPLLKECKEKHSLDMKIKAAKTQNQRKSQQQQPSQQKPSGKIQILARPTPNQPKQQPQPQPQQQQQPQPQPQQTTASKATNQSQLKSPNQPNQPNRQQQKVQQPQQQQQPRNSANQRVPTSATTTASNIPSTNVRSSTTATTSTSINTTTNRTHTYQQQQQTQQYQQAPTTPVGQHQHQHQYQQQHFSSSSSAFTTIATPSVPACTSELAPAPSKLPIPFGLSPITPLTAGSIIPPSPRRNILMENLFNQNSSNSSNKPPATTTTVASDPIALLLSGQLQPKTPTAAVHTNGQQQQTAASGETPTNLFDKLSRINKLRDMLRADRASGKHTLFEASSGEAKHAALCSYVEHMCALVRVECRYEEANMLVKYRGQLFVEGLQLVVKKSRKQPKCRYLTFKKALGVLCQRSELAVRTSETIGHGATNGAGKTLLHELHFVDQPLNDSDSAVSNNSSSRGSNGMPTPQQQQQQQQQQQGDENTSEEHKSAMVSLDMQLKSMMLPVDVPPPPPPQEEGAEEESNMMMTLDDNEENEDENEADASGPRAKDKEKRIKQNLGYFCLFVREPNVELVTDRNALNILNKSCAKSNCNLEFEIKIKSATSGKKTILVKAECAAVSESDNDNDEDDAHANSKSATASKRKYKCKCLINGMKIVSAHASHQIDSKRMAALKAIRYLHKIFPTILDGQYLAENGVSNGENSLISDLDMNSASLPSNISTSATAAASTSAVVAAAPPPTQTYIKITKEELFSGLIPPSLFASATAAAAAATSSLPVAVAAAAAINSSSSAPDFMNLGYRLLTKMGWKGDGHGLGKQEQGVATPIDLDFNSMRMGLGFARMTLTDSDKDDDDNNNNNNNNSNNNNNKNFGGHGKKNNKNKATPGGRAASGSNSLGLQKNVVRLLRAYLSTTRRADMVFDPALSIDQRQLIHREAHKLGLKSHSEGAAQRRFIIISKRWGQANEDIVANALEHGGRFGNFQVLSVGATATKPAK